MPMFIAHSTSLQYLANKKYIAKIGISLQLKSGSLDRWHKGCLEIHGPCVIALRPLIIQLPQDASLTNHHCISIFIN